MLQKSEVPRSARTIGFVRYRSGSCGKPAVKSEYLRGERMNIIDQRRGNAGVFRYSVGFNVGICGDVGISSGHYGEGGGMTDLSVFRRV